MLSSSSSNTISGNSITNNTWHGIVLSSSSSNTISGNSITNNGYGILLGSSLNNTISGNSITNNGYGILLGSSSSNTISGNSITNNTWYGIWLGESSNNTISRNSITGNMDDGIVLQGPHTGNSIHFNRIITASGKFTIRNDGPGLVDARYNWYGRNENVTALIYGDVIFAPWLILSINATPDAIYTGNTSTVTADLRHDSNGTLHNVTYLMDGIPVTFSAILGTVDSDSGNTTNSTATTTFTAGTTPGLANVSAAVDTQTVSTPIRVVGLPTAIASPRGGNFYNNVTVNLTPSGRFDPVRIFFTTDGTTPTNASTRYTVPLTFNTTTTLKFFAQDNEGTNSSVVNETYNIAALPTTIASLPGGNFYNNVTVSLAPTGGFAPVRIFFTTDGTAPTNASREFTVPLTFNTTTVLRFFAQDRLGTNSSVVNETYNIYRQVAYTYSVSVPVRRWVKRWVRSWYKSRGKWKFRWRSRWVSVPATVRVRIGYKSWYKSRGKWKFRWRSRWVRVPRTTTEHRTGQRWELS